MSAQIFVDLATVHPVIDGEWHRAKLTAMPQTGDTVTMLCGKTAAAEYERLDNRRASGIPTCCWDCDAVYRQQRGIPTQAKQSR